MKLNEMKARLAEIPARIEAIAEVAKNEERELSETDGNDILALEAEFDKLEGDIKRADQIQAAQDRILAVKVDEKLRQAAIQQPLEEKKEEPVMKLPAVAAAQKSAHFASNEDAYTAGMFLLAQAGNRKASDFMAAQSVGDDDKGGYSVPTPLAETLINLLEAHGVARAVCQRVVMSAMTWSVPKLLGHASVSYPAEAGNITDSDLTFGQIQLVATKVASLVKMSSEIAEDSVISMMDTCVQSMSYSIALAEDQNLFNGVAGGINAAGIKGDAAVANTAVASVAALALEDLTACTVASGNAIVGARPEWYMNPNLYHGQVRDLLNAAGGNDITHFEGGQKPTLLGYPVNFVNVLGGASASSGDLVAVFGDLGLGCMFGDRRQVTFQVLDQLYAETDQIGVKATERVDIKVANPEVLSKIVLS
jgi:HK97 family phage major capsid protein